MIGYFALFIPLGLSIYWLVSLTLKLSSSHFVHVPDLHMCKLTIRQIIPLFKMCTRTNMKDSWLHAQNVYTQLVVELHILNAAFEFKFILGLQTMYLALPNKYGCVN